MGQPPITRSDCDHTPGPGALLSLCVTVDAAGLAHNDAATAGRLSPLLNRFAGQTLFDDDDDDMIETKP